MEPETNETPQETAQALIETAVALASDAEAPPTEIDIIEARSEADVARIEAEGAARVEQIEAEGMAQAMAAAARAGSPELQERLDQCENRIQNLEAQLASLQTSPAPSPAAVVVTSTPTPSPAPASEAPLTEVIQEANPDEVDGQRESPATPEAPPPARKRFQRL